MKCVNCGEDAGRKGNYHVRRRKFTCKRTKRELRTRRNWLGRREEYYVDVEVNPLAVPYELTDWVGSDDRYYSGSSDYYDRYSGSQSYRSDEPYSSKSSDDSWSSDSGSSSSSYGSGYSSSSYDYGSSSSSSGSGSSSSSYDSGSSSSSSFD